MHEVLSGLDAVAVAALRCSAQATVLIPVILGIRYLFGRHLRAAGRWWLWWIVAGRMLLPWSPGAPFSLFGILEIRHWSASRVGTADGSERGSDRMGDLGPKPSPSSLGETVEPGIASVVPVSERSSAPPWTWSTLRPVARLWALGFVAVLGVIAMDAFRMSRLVRTRTTEPGTRLLDLLDECRRQMGVHGPVALRMGAWVRTPCVWGGRDPTVLLPAGIEATISTARLRHILLHELAHVARHDLRWGLVLRLVQALHWFNPVVPWLLRRMRLEREIATDTRVLDVVGAAGSSEYGETLLVLLAEGAARISGLRETALGTTDSPADMEERVRAIASFTAGRGRSRMAVPLIAALAVVCWTNASTPGTPGTKQASPDIVGSLVAWLPKGDDLGKGWSNRITSLVDRGSPGREYFDSGVFQPARELIRSHVPEGTAFCDMAYFRGGNLVLDAWLQRRESTNGVKEQWTQLQHAPLQPRLSDGRVPSRISRRIGDLETILYDGDSRTLWMASGRCILNLNLYGEMPLEEIFSIAEVFARRLMAGQQAPARAAEGNSPAATGAWYAVRSIGDMYTAVRRVHTNHVAVSRAFRKPDDVRAYLTITNSESVPILVWNVRVQVRGQAASHIPGGWDTVSSDYPSCVAGIPAGTAADACVFVPSRAPWRVAFLYTAQRPDGLRGSPLPPHLLGDHEVISATEETVELALAPDPFALEPDFVRYFGRRGIDELGRAMSLLSQHAMPLPLSNRVSDQAWTSEDHPD